jgi:pimeloyl-ACP methyl ester carboxylesterase
MLRVALAAFLVLCTLPARAECPPASTIAHAVYGGGLCLAATTFGLETAGERPILVVVVHGDISDGGAATYHVAFARLLARPGVIAVALNRPGYVDGEGRASQGATLGRGDNYTADNIAAVGGAIGTLKTHYAARRVVYVGHSGGAAIGGVLIGRRRGLIDAAVLISCPCDITRWLTQGRRAPWSRSLSPSTYTQRVPATTEVVAITGAADLNTTADLARDYVAALVRRGVPARFVSVEGAGHGFSGLREASAAVVRDLIGN